MRPPQGWFPVSYSHHDAQPYVQRLATNLRDNRVNVWHDNEIITGDRWVRVIEQRLSMAAAVIAVMTPAGDESRWVHRELDRAEALGLTIFPVLVTGTPYFRISDLQHFDARGGGLPGYPFTSRIRALMETPGPPGPEWFINQPISSNCDSSDHNDYVGRAGSTVELLLQLIEDHTRILGPDHLDILTSRTALAWALEQAGKWTDAVNMYQALIPDQTRILGPDHPNILTSRTALAWALGQAGRWIDAVNMYQALIPDQTRILGPDHPNILSSRAALAWARGQLSS
jgi:hypothetical protein